MAFKVPMADRQVERRQGEVPHFKGVDLHNPTAFGANDTSVQELAGSISKISGATIDFASKQRERKAKALNSQLLNEFKNNKTDFLYSDEDAEEERDGQKYTTKKGLMLRKEGAAKGNTNRYEKWYQEQLNSIMSRAIDKESLYYDLESINQYELPKIGMHEVNESEAEIVNAHKAGIGRNIKDAGTITTPRELNTIFDEQEKMQTYLDPSKKDAVIEKTLDQAINGALLRDASGTSAMQLLDSINGRVTKEKYSSAKDYIDKTVKDITKKAEEKTRKTQGLNEAQFLVDIAEGKIDYTLAAPTVVEDATKGIKSQEFASAYNKATYNTIVKYDKLGEDAAFMDQAKSILHDSDSKSVLKNMKKLVEKYGNKDDADSRRKLQLLAQASIEVGKDAAKQQEMQLIFNPATQWAMDAGIDKTEKVVIDSLDYAIKGLPPEEALPLIKRNEIFRQSMTNEKEEIAAAKIVEAFLYDENIETPVYQYLLKGGAEKDQAAAVAQEIAAAQASINGPMEMLAIIDQKIPNIRSSISQESREELKKYTMGQALTAFATGGAISVGAGAGATKTEDYNPRASMAAMLQTVSRLPANLKAATYAILEDYGQGASVVNRSKRNEYIQKVNKQNRKLANELYLKYGNKKAAPVGPITIKDIQELSKNLANSLTNMGAAALSASPAAAIPNPAAAGATAFALGTTGAYNAAFRMAHYNYLQGALEVANNDKIALTGKGLTLAEENEIKGKYEKEAKAYSRWEAGTEAASAMLTLGVFTAPFAAAVEKAVGKGLAKKVIGGASSMLVTELGGETITEKKQTPLLYASGQSDVAELSWWQAMKAVAPQTFLLTLAIGGAGVISKTAINTIEQSVKKEVKDKTLAQQVMEKVYAGVDPERSLAEQIDEQAEIHNGELIAAANANVNNLTTQEIEGKKAEEILARNGIKDTVVKLVDEIITNEGKQARGSAKKGEINIAKIATTTTGYHEGFHRISAEVLTQEENDAVNTEFDGYKGLNGREGAAEAFADYANDRDAARLSNEAKSAFDKMLQYVLSNVGSEKGQAIFADVEANKNDKTFNGDELINKTLKGEKLSKEELDFIAKEYGSQEEFQLANFEDVNESKPFWQVLSEKIAHAEQLEATPEQIESIKESQSPAELQAKISGMDLRTHRASMGIYNKIADITTPEFKAWFGDSKVVDKDGAPLVVYHGSPEVFDAFDKKYIGLQGKAEGAGFYFTDDPSLARGFKPEKSGKLYEVYLSMKNPLERGQEGFSNDVFKKILKKIAKDEAARWDQEIADGFLSNWGDVRSEGLESVINNVVDSLSEETAIDQMNDLVSQNIDFDIIGDAIKEITGHDGIIVNNDGTNIYVAFNPTQIKSTTNTGSFSLNDDRMEYQQDYEVKRLSSPQNIKEAPTKIEQPIVNDVSPRVRAISKNIPQSRGAGIIPARTENRAEDVMNFADDFIIAMQANPETYPIVFQNPLVHNADYGTTFTPSNNCTKGKTFTYNMITLRNILDEELKGLPDKERAAIKTTAARKLLEAGVKQGLETPCLHCYTTEKQLIGYSAKPFSFTHKIYKKGMIDSKVDGLRETDSIMRGYGTGDFSAADIPSLINLGEDLAKHDLGAGFYTKNLNLLEIFGDVGFKFNISVADDIHVGLPLDIAKAYRERYENAGIVAIATNDSQLELFGNDESVDLLIPTHLGGGTPAKYLESLTGTEWKSYTSTQLEKVKIGGKELNLHSGADVVSSLPNIEKARKMVKESKKHRDVAEYNAALAEASKLIGADIIPMFNEFKSKPWYSKLIGTLRGEYGKNADLPKIDMSKMNVAKANEYASRPEESLDALNNKYASMAKTIAKAGMNGGVEAIDALDAETLYQALTPSEEQGGEEGTFAENLKRSELNIGNVSATARPLTKRNIEKEVARTLKRQGEKISDEDMRKAREDNLLGAETIDEIIARKRGIITDEEAVARATALKGTIDDVLNIPKGSVPNKEQMTAIAQIVQQEREINQKLVQLITEGGVGSTPEERSLIANLKDGKALTEEEVLQQALEQSTIKLRKAEIVLFAAKSEAGRALQGAKQIVDAVDSRLRIALNKIKKLPIENRQAITELLGHINLQDNQAFIDFLDKIDTADNFDKIAEWATAIKLYNPTTHFVNFGSNAVRQLVDAGITGALSPKYAKADAQGAIVGLRQGVKNALRAMTDEGYASQLSKYIEEGGTAPAVKGKKGEILRTSFRLLGAGDEIFKAIAFQRSMYRQAARMANNDQQKMQELLNRPTIEMIEEAEKQAQKMTFQEDMGEISKRINEFRTPSNYKSAPGKTASLIARIFIPFLKTPVNLAKQAVDLSPLGLLKNQKALSEAVKKGDDEGAKRIIGEAVFGTLVMGVVAGLVSDDRITGGAPRDAAERDQFYREGKLPYAIRFGGKWHQYKRVDPVSTVLGITADAIELINEEDFNVGGIIDLILQNLEDKTFLAGMSDLMKIFTGEPWERSAAIKSAIIGTTIPSLVGHVARSVDPKVRAAKTLKEKATSQIPFVSTMLPARVDVLGGDIERANKGLNYFFNPIQSSVAEVDPITKHLTDIGYAIKLPPTSFSVNKVKYKLSPEEYYDFQKYVGARIAESIAYNMGSRSYENSDIDEKIKIISKERDDIMKEWKEAYVEGKTAPANNATRQQQQTLKPKKRTGA